jgi:hypothetical protein
MGLIFNFLAAEKKKKNFYKRINIIYKRHLVKSALSNSFEISFFAQSKSL